MSTPLPNGTSIRRTGLTSKLARNGTSTAGVALIIVLCMLVLAAALVIAFMSSVATELRSAKSYAVGLDARSLTDSAVNVVISQIQDATATATNAWASQPGMIRTYDTSGNVLKYYKLYSADVMRTNSFNPNSGTAADPTSQSTDVPSNWATLPDQYTDLNKPVTNSGFAHYPIIDPSAVANAQSSTTAMDGTTTPIQGCYVDTANGAIATTSQNNPVPMPVKWLYILQDGTIASISATGTITATSSTGSTLSPTTANPIVGRIAFWADDESCKVNINTSAEGTFWGRAHAESPTSAASASGYAGYERSFLDNTLPAQNEFQRYPGHPAMTSLSVIFPPQNGETTVAYNERVYGIIPRLATGGSTSGSVAVNGTTTALVPNTARLFSTVDEFMFSATGTTTRSANLKSPSTSFSQTDIEKTRFFLTANSRAPEVNMFNKPRITLWPLQANTVNNSTVTAAPACWTAKDKLIAFCSTIGGTPYYFQRYNSFDTATLSNNNFSLKAVSTTPNTIPSSQSTTLDWTMNASGTINRNQTLYTYLQYLTSNPIPGVGGSLSGASGKYTVAVRDQILTEMMDFIRSEISTASTGTTPSYFYAPGQSSGLMVTGERQIVPLEFNPPTYPGNGTSYTSGTASYTTKGFGRFDTIMQAALVFYRLDPMTVTGNGSTPYTGGQNTTPIPGGTSTPSTFVPTSANPINIGVVLLLNPWNPTPGSRSWCENMRVKVTLTGTTSSGGGGGHGGGGGGSAGVMLVNGVPLNGSTAYSSSVPTNTFMTATGTSTATLLLDGLDEYCNATAMMGPDQFFYYNNAGGTSYKILGLPTVGSTTEDKYYPFYGSFTLPIPSGSAYSGTMATPGTFSFTPPTSITIQLYSAYDPTAVSTGVPSAGNLVQTITMAFPSGAISLPVPTVSFSPSSTTTSGTYTQSNGNELTSYTSTTQTDSYNNLYGRIGHMDAAYQHNASPLVTSGDTVRSIETRYGGTTTPFKLPAGDLRLSAGLVSVPSTFFNSYGATGSDDGTGVSNGYGSTTEFVHSLRMYPITGVDFLSNDCLYGGYSGSYGSLIGPAGAGYYVSSNPGRVCLYPCVPRGLSSTQVVLANSTTSPGDWDTGPGNQTDGPYINKPDESNAGYQGGFTTGSSQYGGGITPEEQGTTYSPNRMISSAVAFGSLPTGIDPSITGTVTTAATGAQSAGGLRPWQTLLFCPNPSSESNNSGNPIHPGFGSNSSGTTTAPPFTLPPDYAFLDFFTMPIVEPYAISEPFSTAGKVNMNYQIVPFTYLTRDTAVRAVLKSVRMMVIPLNNGGGGTVSSVNYGTVSYKAPGTSPPDYRYTLNPDEVTGTLAGFQNRFSNGDIFRSAAEICGLYLIPQYQVNWNSTSGGETVSTTAPPSAVPTTFTSASAMSSAMNTWWKSYALTGDNLREEPYGYIYPRLTTKSNTYTVHVWTQTLKKTSTTNPAQFVDNVDQVTSEFRGSYIVQRYLDPNSSSLVTTDGTSPANPETYANSMVGPYKYRVIGTKRFAP